MDDLRYTSDSFWYRVQIIITNVKTELPRTFNTYEHLFALAAPQHNIGHLTGEYLEYQMYALKEIEEPLLFWGMHVPD